MASSPSHKLGQKIGDLLEELITPLLENFCAQHRGLYLDRKGARVARPRRTVTWCDKHGNSHDLDFVIERGGTPYKIGHPVAFIEAAWRRYTKHSKNKAQEIQGAVIPIAEKYAWDSPFLGAFLAGVFTDPSIEQMKSAGFVVSLFPYSTIVAAFATVNIDVNFDEQTSDAHFADIVSKIEDLNQQRMDMVKEKLIELNSQQIENFFKSLGKALNKGIERICVIPLHGKTYEFTTINALLSFIDAYHGDNEILPLLSYEIFVRYNNGSEIRSQFKEKDEIYTFLDYIANSIL